MASEVVKLKRVRKKRVTVDVKPEIDKIRDKIKQDTGVTMTYVQTIDFLIDFYMKNVNVPRTQWAVLK